MRRFRMPSPTFLIMALAVAPTANLAAQTPELRPVTVGSPMPDFSLPTYQGGDFTLSELRGKNVMLVFPRGLSSPTSWCHVCPYQLAELAEYDAKMGFRTNANLEIVFVLPYGNQKVGEFIAAFPTLLQDIEDWKNPADPAGLDEAGRARMERVRQIFPKTFKMQPEDVLKAFPILVDADRAVSDGLGFFTTDWGGSDAEQNVPAVLIVDEAGVLQFKYMSQNTVDRPPLEYLVGVMEALQGMGS